MSVPSTEVVNAIAAKTLEALRESLPVGSRGTIVRDACDRAIEKLIGEQPAAPKFVPPDLPNAKGVGISGWMTCDANHPFVCVYLELPQRFHDEHGEWELGHTDDEEHHEKIARAVFGDVRGKLAIRPVTITINEREKR